ncbi:HNH endonuclease [Comamonas sp. JC664]|uniref:HNH endonuclease n=1 Tax=Comamonas sp. JC664 TaxID=2801917 RepID=UPI0017491594|nr:HNH endonuclease [Comamonas sp. JC664]MBL0692609.1 HNH endonuclease [Comamonas sp. JC664]GHG92878.1 hypothetical protein GCM10012319_54740 [Comamonas sp. KCTC 72670]
MAGKLKTRVNSSGYKQFWDKDEQRWVFTHRRVAEKKIGREPVPGEEVHHINGDKTDNRRQNLVVLKDSVHDRVHQEDPDACFRCGRSGHWAEDCYAATDFEGDDIDEEDDIDDEDEDWDDEDWDDEDEDDDY